MRAIPWRQVVRFAGVGALLLVAVVLLDVGARGNPVGIVQPGAAGPSAAVFATDFPDLTIPDGLGHDGQQFYAVARTPMHLDEVSEFLDRPRYRLQRPLFPVLAWALHPQGGGYGLVYALVAVGALSVFALGVATGALSAQLGGGAWPAFVATVLPGVYSALRLTLADTLALALLVAALALAERRHTLGAVGAAALSVLAKESTLVVLVAHAVFRRTRSAVAAAVAAGGVAFSWWLALHALVRADSRQVLEFTWPFGGVVRSLDDWFRGEDLFAAVTVTVTFALAAVALWRRRNSGHPLMGALGGVTLFSVFLGPDVVGLNFNGPRTLGPVLLLAVLVLGSPGDGVHDPASVASGRGSARRG